MTTRAPYTLHKNDRLKNRVVSSASCCCIFAFGLLTSASSLFAQEIALPASSVTTPAAKLPKTATSAKNSPTPLITSKPVWKDLSQAQQQSLAPLSARWNFLEEAQKRKWIAIAANYPLLGPTEQEKLHSRMTEWVSLSYQDRVQARLNFAQSKQLSSTEKTATWQAYQALSPEEKQKLASVPLPKLAGAAISVKPVTTQKITTVPVNRQSSIQLHKISPTNNKEVNRITLLPNAKSLAEPAPSPTN